MKLLILFLSIYLTHSQGKNLSFCTKVHKQEDAKGKGFFDAKRSCEINFSENKKKFGLQLAVFKSACVAGEGDIPRDCAIVRTCAEEKDLIRQSTALHKKSLQAVCDSDDKKVDLIFYSKRYKGPKPKALLECKEGNKLEVTLKHQGQTQKCPLQL